MGKLSLLLVAAALLGSVVVYRSVQQNVIEGERQLITQTNQAAARIVAQTGLAEATQAYVEDFQLLGRYAGPANLSGQYNGGSYHIHINNSSPVTSIKVVGTYGTERYTIERLYDESSANGPPSFMNSAVTCERDISVTAAMSLTSVDTTKNANLMANRMVRILQPSTVEGFAFHGGQLNLNQPAEDIFQPNTNPSSEPITQQIAPVNIPPFNAADHAGLATVTSYSNVNLSGPIALGTKESPMIWYIDGNLHITGPTLFSGYGILLVTGDVHFLDSISFSDETSRSSLGLYANKNIIVNSPNLTLGGQWYTDRSFVFNHAANFRGSLTSRGGDCLFNNPVAITYTPASVELTSPIWGTTMGLRPLRSREW